MASIERFVYCWLKSAVEQMDKLTVYKSGLTQLGVSAFEIVLTRSDGINPGGAWTGESLAKLQFNHAMHGVVDVKPHPERPLDCFLNALLVPHYVGKNCSSRLAGHYDIDDGRLRVDAEHFKPNFPHDLDVSMFGFTKTKESDIEAFEQANPNVSVTVWKYTRDTPEPTQMYGTHNPDAEWQSDVVLTLALNPDGTDNGYHYVGLKEGACRLLRHKTRKVHPCRLCGHKWMSLSARDTCQHGEPRLTRKFPGGSVQIPGGATADAQDVVVVVDLEAHGSEKQIVNSVGMWAYQPPLREGDPPVFLDLDDITKSTAKVWTHVSANEGEATSAMLRKYHTSPEPTKQSATRSAATWRSQ